MSFWGRVWKNLTGEIERDQYYWKGFNDGYKQAEKDFEKEK